MCRTLPCALRGADDVLEHCEKRLGIHVRRDDAGRQGHAAHRRVPRELRHRADDAGRQGLLREPHAASASTRSSTSSARLTRELTTHAQAHATTSRAPTASRRAGRSPPTSASSRGYQAARRVLTTMTREQVVDEAKKANIRGRGGAGFPMGVKWSFMPRPSATKPALPRRQRRRGRARDAQGPDADGAEPARRASRGASSAATASARTSRTSTCATSSTSRRRASRARSRRRSAKGYLGKTPFGKDYPVEVYVHTGAGAYICGEETSLLNSLEGRRGEPRMKPPFPAQAGAFGCPTTVNNLETIAVGAHGVRDGRARSSRSSRALHSHRTTAACRLFGVNGHVKKPRDRRARGRASRCASSSTTSAAASSATAASSASSPAARRRPSCARRRRSNAPDAKSPAPRVARQERLRRPARRRHDARASGRCSAPAASTVIAEGTDPVLAHAEPDAVLPPRVVRPVHAVPRRQRVARLRAREKILDGKASMEELDEPARHRQRHHGQHHLRVRRGDGDAGARFLQKFRQEFEAVRARRARSAPTRRSPSSPGD